MQQQVDVTHKWATYAISHVRLNAARTHIDQVMLWPVNADGSLGNPNPTLRVAAIQVVEGSLVKTMIEVPGTNQYREGARVRVIELGGVKYLTTSPNLIGADNLGSLPEF